MRERAARGNARAWAVKVISGGVVHGARSRRARRTRGDLHLAVSSSRGGAVADVAAAAARARMSMFVRATSAAFSDRAPHAVAARLSMGVRHDRRRHGGAFSSFARAPHRARRRRSYSSTALRWRSAISRSTSFRVALRTDQAVYSLVLPWHGKMKDQQPGSFDEGADYVLAVLDALQLHQFILVGYSLGGATGSR